MTSVTSRLDHLDATRAFALLLGIAFHAALSFSPTFMGWAVQDVSTSPFVGWFFVVSHSFRMETFFLLAGFFSCLTLGRSGTRDFVRSRVLRIGIPFVVGWFILRPLIVSGWIMGGASLRGDYDFWSSIGHGFRSLDTLPAGIFTGSHLWFLYYLGLITALALVARGLLNLRPGLGATVARGADRTVGWLANSRLALLALAVPTSGALWFMRYWGMDTPDQSLRPHVPVLLVYGGFFAVGWALHRQPAALVALSRLSLARGLLAAGCALATIQLAGVQHDPSHEYFTLARVSFALCYAVMMWLLVFLTMGVCEKFFAQPRAWVRYLADASYWMYLIHLPIVVWLQVAVAEVPWHWTLKLTGISLATIALSLVTYDLFVRSTWMGALLNGRRRERALSTAFRSLRIPTAVKAPL